MQRVMGEGRQRAMGEGCNVVSPSRWQFSARNKTWGLGVGSSGLLRRGRVSIRYIFYGQDSISVVGHPRAFAQEVWTLHSGRAGATSYGREGCCHEFGRGMLFALPRPRDGGRVAFPHYLYPHTIKVSQYLRLAFSLSRWEFERVGARARQEAWGFALQTQPARLREVSGAWLQLRPFPLPVPGRKGPRERTTRTRGPGFAKVEGVPVSGDGSHELRVHGVRGDIVEVHAARSTEGCALEVVQSFLSNRLSRRGHSAHEGHECPRAEERRL